jgi:hypothetical protein
MYVIACADEAETAFPVEPRFVDVCKVESSEKMNKDLGVFRKCHAR